MNLFINSNTNKHNNNNSNSYQLQLPHTKVINGQYINVSDGIVPPAGKVRRVKHNKTRVQKKKRMYKPKAVWAQALHQLQVGQSMGVPTDVVRTSLYIFAKRLKYNISVKNDHTGQFLWRCYRLQDDIS